MKTLIPRLLPVLLIATACSEKAPAPRASSTSPSVPVASAPTETPAPVDDTPPPSSAGWPRPAEDPASLSEHWLIILDSEGDEAKRKDRLEKLVALDVKMSVATLRSSEFKGLMPCYDILIANAFKEKAEALAYSKALTAQGVGNYPKNAGRYVGRQPAVEDYCAGGIAPVSCSVGLFLAVTHAEQTFIHLNLDAVAEERARAHAPKATLLEQHGAWEQPLQAKTLGGLSVGDALIGVDESGAALQCKVKGFNALTRGVAHFAADDDHPTCGEPSVFAEIDCPGAVTAWLPSSPIQIARRVEQKAKGPRPSPALMATIGETRAEAAAHAKEQGVPVVEERSSETWGWGERRVSQGIVHVFTGEGFDECGGPDFDATLHGWEDESKVIRPLDQAWYRETLAVIVDDGDPLEVVKESFGDRAIMTLEGDTLCRLPMPFCDCGC